MNTKKTLLLFIVLNGVLFFNQQRMLAQSAYHDAKKLEAQITANTIFKIQTLPVLNEYYQVYQTYDANQLVEYRKKINNALSQNPFLRKYSLQTGGELSQANITETLTGTISSIGGLPISTVADGLAQFLIERAKQELVIAYFEKFKKVLNRPEFKHLFPTTNDYLSVFQVHQISTMLNAFRDAFISDLKNLPSRLAELNKVDGYEKLFTSNEGRLVRTGLLLVDPLREGQNIAQIIARLDEDPTGTLQGLSGEFANIYPAIQLSHLISNSFRSTEPGKIWIDIDQIKSLIRDDTAMNIYLGLIYEIGTDIVFAEQGSKVNFREVMREVSGDLGKIQILKNEFEKFGGAINRANEAWNSVDKQIKEGKKITLNDLSSYSSSFTNLLYQSNQMAQQLITYEESHKKFGDLLSKINRTISMTENLSDKQYNAALIDASVLVKGIFEDEKITEYFIKYGTLISTIAEADSAKQVKQIIESSVLPPTSYRAKRTSSSSIDLNAYLGGFTGLDLETNNLRAGAGIGVWAPVGLAFSSSKDGASNSLFISILDLGAFASYRIGNTEEELPEFELQNIISPGLLYVRGIKESPISWHIGAQYGPNVREVEIGVKAASLRIHAGISVDIPLINFETVIED